MREYGPVGKAFGGDTDAAKTRIGIARTQLGIMKNMMALGGLQQLVRNVKLADGTLIRVQSIFGQDRISITVPPGVAVGEGAAGEMVSAVNTAVDYVGVAMPNPVPYRGVSIGVVDIYTATTVGTQVYGSFDIRQSAYATFVTEIYYNGGIVGSVAGSCLAVLDASYTITYNNTPTTGYPVLAFSGSVDAFVQGTYTEVVAGVGPVIDSRTNQSLGGYFGSAGNKATIVMASDGTVLASEAQNTTGGHTYYVPDTIWNGDAYCNMYVDSVTPANLNHQLAFTVPEDCIYPVPATPPAVFNTRRKAWFKKNSTEFIAALKTGFAANATGVTRAELKTGSLPASWDYAIKKNYNKDYDKTAYKLRDNSFAGHHTKMPIVMSITSAADVIESDTSANLTQAGTKITRRTTTFQYVDAKEVNWSEAIDGRLTQVVTQHTGGPAGMSQTDTYLNWYEMTYPSESSYTVAPWTKLKQQFIGDQSGYSVGAIWNGAEAGVGDLIPLFGNTTWRSTPLYDMAYTAMTPAWPFYSNTLAGTAPDIFLQYHNTVLPQYVANTAQSSTAMNNSAMYHITHVELIPFGLVTTESLGVFPDSSENGTRVEIYGKAIYKFDWSTGSLTFQGWNPMRDPNGNIASKTITIPGNYSAAGYNCLVGYVWDNPDQMWPDVEEYLRKKVATVATADPILYTLIKEAVAL